MLTHRKLGNGKLCFLVFGKLVFVCCNTVIVCCKTK